MKPFLQNAALLFFLLAQAAQAAEEHAKAEPPAAAESGKASAAKPEAPTPDSSAAAIALTMIAPITTPLANGTWGAWEIKIRLVSISQEEGAPQAKEKTFILRMEVIDRTNSEYRLRSELREVAGGKGKTSGQPIIAMISVPRGGATPETEKNLSSLPVQPEPEAKETKAEKKELVPVGKQQLECDRYVLEIPAKENQEKRVSERWLSSAFPLGPVKVVSPEAKITLIDFGGGAETQDK